MNLTLCRTDFLASGIFGYLEPDDGSFELFTLEHAYADDSVGHYQPKLPVGEYTCVRGEHRLAGMSAPFFTFEITGVPGHTNILFHPGNTEKDSSGCVLLGMARLNDTAILNSREAFDIFMNALVGTDKFQLTVI